MTHRYVYSELAQVERAALARGPRTRTGLGGFVDDALHLSSPIPDWAQRAIEATGLAIVTGGIARAYSGSWKTAAKVGGGVAVVYGVGALALTAYRQSQVIAHDSAPTT